MPTSVVFPKASLEKTSGEISAWSVSAGDKVSTRRCPVRSRRRQGDRRSGQPADGYIGRLAEIGEEIDVGDVVATIYDTREEMEAEAAAPAAAENAPAAPPTAAVVPVAAGQQIAASADRVRSTPLARRIARDNGVDVAVLSGTDRMAGSRNATCFWR